MQFINFLNRFQLPISSLQSSSLFLCSPLGIKHRKNEIFLDVVEKLNLLVSSNGTVLHSEIIGSVQMKSFLSGTFQLCSMHCNI